MPPTMTIGTTEKGPRKPDHAPHDGKSGMSSVTPGTVAQAAPAGGSGWFAGSPAADDREDAVDTDQLLAFLQITLLEESAKLGLGDCRETKNMARPKLLISREGRTA